NIKEKKLSKEAVNIKLEETKKRISENIAGENTDLQHVYKPLNLYTYDPISQVKIQWYSNDLDLVDTTGKVDGLNIHQPVEVVLKAELTLDENNQSYEVKLRVVPFFQYASIEEKMHVRIEELLSNIASGAEGSMVVLPSQIEDIQIQWLKPKQNINGVIVVSLISLLFFLITTQYKGLDKEIKKKKEDIERDFPEFINKLVLLLNAGLIVESALEIITEDYKRYGKHKPLYEELSMVIRNVQESHASLSEELRCFAQRCGVKEMMRFVSIVRENIHLGSSLVQKLELEAAQSWENRKHKAEILGRLAETKLTFPLVILLLVLIIIIMTPAFMEM
ncbi:MAG: type II secretion system F family protein, partial [Clostridia bacterium]|nr:type II secretion system F family protein [Clostridia bacterium]